MSKQRLFYRHYYNRGQHGMNYWSRSYTLVISEEARTVGVAVCSKSDRYNRKLGVQLARRRMLNHSATDHRKTMGKNDWLIVAPHLKYSTYNDPVPMIMESLTNTYAPENVTVLRAKVKP
jgi:hypothetical protein